MHPNLSFLFLFYSRLGQKGGSRSSGCGRACSLPPPTQSAPLTLAKVLPKHPALWGSGLISFLGSPPAAPKKRTIPKPHPF